MKNSKKLGPGQIPLSKCEICDKEFKTNKSLKIVYAIELII